jgi:hypothetical protein
MTVSTTGDSLTVFELPPPGAAERLYTVSRDLYAPVLAVFAARCLRTLARDPGALNVCLARDGISAFLAQRALLRVLPEQFGGIAARRVRLAYLSRPLIGACSASPATRALVDRYLVPVGLRRTRRITLVDVGIHGSIQDELQRLYPQRQLRGEYLLYRRRPTDLNAQRKRGFLVGDGEAEDERYFLRREMIHPLEDLWSGVFESVIALRAAPRNRGGRVHPQLERLGTRTTLPLPASELQRLKRVALRGVVDGVIQAAPQCAMDSQADPQAETGARQRAVEHARRLADWIASSRESGSRDAWLWRTVIRPDRSTPSLD